MGETSPIILWFRRDLRLADHPALAAAAASGRPVIPLFIHDQTAESLGAAPNGGWACRSPTWAPALARWAAG